MKTVTAAEYYNATRVAGADIRRMSGKRYYCEYVSVCGIAVGEKHQTITRGKVVDETFYLVGTDKG